MFHGIYTVDIHSHCGPHSEYQVRAYDGDGIVHNLDLLGIDVTCLSSSPAAHGDYGFGNGLTMKATAKYPDRIKGYLTVTPHYPEFDVDSYFGEGTGFIGIKIIAMLQQVEINDHRYDPFYEYADRHGLPILFHAWTPAETKQTAEIAARYPNTRCIFGHSGFTYDESKQAAIEACRKLDNIILDTTLSTTYDGALEWLVDKVGADRVAYGSDMVAFECAQTLGRIYMSKLSDWDKEKILGLNAKEFLHL